MEAASLDSKASSHYDRAVTPSRIKPAGKVFRDPIHQLIRIDREDEFILDLIDTPVFQRLRRIRQLGVSWITYPGAEHSRFVHSLGVFNFVQRMLQVLTRRYAGHDVAEYLTKYGKLAKAAALLHDIGHGPFSHMIERAFGSHAKHEAKTVEMIKDTKGMVAPALAKHGINADDVADIIQHASPHSLLTDLVSSQLDGDRMDYLLRDSYCTGVQYGSYDAEWLLNAMCVGRNPSGDTANGALPSWRLSLDERRGEKAAEQFILARAHMNEQVYFHRVTRGFEALLLNLFRSASKVAKSGGLPSATSAVVSQFFANEGRLTLSEWMRFDESVLLSAMHEWSTGTFGIDPTLARLSTAFLNRERIYSCVGIGSLKSLQFMDLQQALQEEGLDQNSDWCTDNSESAVYKGILFASRSKRGDDEEAMIESILLASGKPDRKARPIETSSELMKHLDQQRHSVIRLYFDHSKQSRFEKVISKFDLKIESRGGLE
jgi:HD superfamily phosphohydrolase